MVHCKAVSGDIGDENPLQQLNGAADPTGLDRELLAMAAARPWACGPGRSKLMHNKEARATPSALPSLSNAPRAAQRPFRFAVL